MIDDLFKPFDGAFSENILLAYRSDFEKFQIWCAETSCSPFNGAPATLANYVEYMSENLAPASVSRKLTSLNTVLKLSDHDDPTKAPEIVLALKRIYRKKGRSEKQAIPLTRNVLDQLLAVCGDDLQGKRDAVMLRRGNETMRRRSELCRFKFKDLERLPNGKTGIRLRFSKADQMSKGKLIPISIYLYQSNKDWGGADCYVWIYIAQRQPAWAGWRSTSPSQHQPSTQVLTEESGALGDWSLKRALV